MLTQLEDFLETIRHAEEHTDDTHLFQYILDTALSWEIVSAQEVSDELDASTVTVGIWQTGRHPPATPVCRRFYVWLKKKVETKLAQ